MVRWLPIGALVTTTIAATVFGAVEFTTASDLVKLVRAAIAHHTADKTLAKTLRDIRLIERLDLRAAEELESEGAGPESVAVLESLVDQSVNMPASTEIPPFLSPARPTLQEQKEFFRRLNINAMHYTAGLPNFICSEIVHRYERQLKSGLVSASGIPAPVVRPWSSRDELTVKLSYFDNREKYELELVNGKKSKLAYESSGGAISEGDFGSIMLELFDPASATKFQWDHWTHLRKRLTRVYSYHTSREKSHYRIGVGRDFRDRRVITAGRRGYVYADDETAMVMRIVGHADEIPEGFPVRAQSSIMDYDYGDVAGKRFLLPMRIENQMITARIAFRNVIEFRNYRKFTGESSISFGDPDTPPQQ